MFNVQMEKRGNHLVIMIPVTGEGRASGSGKSTIIATTEGNVELLSQGIEFLQPDGETPRRVVLGLNLYEPKG